MLAVDVFWKGQMLIKVSGKYMGVVGEVIKTYPYDSPIKTRVKIRIPFDKYRSDKEYKHFNKMIDVRHFRPAKFYV